MPSVGDLSLWESDSVVFHGDNIHTTAATIELHATIDQSEEGVIFAQTNPPSRMKTSSHLAYKDIASANQLAAEPFHTPALPVGITAVAAGTLTFFMCHVCFSLTDSSTRTPPLPRRDGE
jgi:hypothetical protein